jgi:large subunit ribosomal protein L1
MAKTKGELLEEAQSMGVDVTAKNTVAEITAAIAAMSQTPVEPVEAGDLGVAEAGEVVQAQEAETEEKVAKAGKRSAKGLKEADDKQAKIEGQKHRDEQSEATESTPKAPIKPARSRLERRSKGFRKAAEQIEKGKLYSLQEAADLAAKTSSVKFDATVELHVNLAVDPRHADQNIRDNLVLPNGTGKSVRVAVFSDETVDTADVTGVVNITKALDKGSIDFDVLISTPANMPKLGKYARLLGPRGLMPNPKSGTVTQDIAKAVTEAKAGRVEYRVDSTGIVHLAVGKVSFGGAKLSENLQAVFASLRSNKPSSVKGSYIKAVHVTTTMGPSIAVEVSSTS